MAILDALLTRVMRLPRPTGRYRVTRGLRIPMRDGVTLAADHYTPGGETLGTLALRGPYGRGFPYDVLYARVFAARGYHVLFASSRGTAASEGVFDPMRTELEDGQDVVAWLIAQPWFTGTFATVGPSYLGYTQWTQLTDPPPQLTTAVITVGPHDFSRHAWGTGAFNLDMVGWADMIGRRPRSDRRPGPLGMLRDPRLPRARRRVFRSWPLADAADRHFAGRAPWFRDRVTRPDLSDPFWAPMQHGSALDKSTIPVLLHSGWQDLFLRQTFEQYGRLRDRGVEVALTVGPWSHVEAIGKGAAVLIPEALSWLSSGMAGREAPVRIFVTGGGGWRSLAEWPPPAQTRTLYLGPRGELVAEPYPGLADVGGAVAGTGSPEGRFSDATRPDPAAPDPAGPGSAEFEATFVFDPDDPTPTMGGPLLDDGGYVDDTALAARSDVLTFTSAPLPAELEIIGAPGISLDHTSDTGHFDLFVRLSELDNRNRSRNVTEGYARNAVRLELLPTAHRFAAGSRLRLMIAGGSVPQFARNPGTGDHPSLATTAVPTRHTITGGRLTIPVPD
jgi:predicted acyl esterase